MKAKIYHWAILFLALVITACGPTDPRRALFKEDEDKLESPSLTKQAPDTLALELKALFNETVNPELKPREFSYHTRMSDDGQRLLVLIQMPTLKKAEKESRTEVVGIVQTWHELSPSLRSMKLYLGVKGSYTWMITKAPGQEADNSLIASESDLYDFYGPREQFETEEKQ
jgi:hypothetical protein